MNVLDRRSSGAKEDRCKIGALCWCKSSHQIYFKTYPIETLAALCTVPRYPGRAFSEKSAGLPSFFKQEWRY